MLGIRKEHADTLRKVEMDNREYRNAMEDRQNVMKEIVKKQNQEINEKEAKIQEQYKELDAIRQAPSPQASHSSSISGFESPGEDFESPDENFESADETLRP